MESEIWVVNSSPLISLARIQRLDLLSGSGRRLLVPHAVALEVLQGPEEDPARSSLEGGFAAPYPTVDLDPDLSPWGLGSGESAVLSLARRIGATAVVDDRDARVAANTLGIRTIGTLGVVLDARRAGRIAAAAPVVRLLHDAGLRLSHRVIADALWRAFGERWE